MEEAKKMRPREYIKIRGANEHNLKNINVDIPRNELVVLTGMSGSGKSSLAFDTIYAEGQRRYMESLSSYARQFLGQMEKPNVESIEGLSPAISIDQKSTNRNPRSTVGTVTEIYDYFRLLYARIGIPHCPKCGREIAKQTVDQMVDQIMNMGEGTKIQLLAPVVRGRKGEHAKVLERAKRSGYVRVRIDGSMYELTEEIKLDKNIKHNIDIVVDRLVVKDGIQRRLTDSIENVLELAEGLLVVDVIGGEPVTFSQSFSCPDCGISVSEVEPRSFSFNNPFGACPVCFGLGYKMEFDEDLMIPDKRLSINEGAITVMGWQSCADKSSFTNAILRALAKEYNFDLDTPFQDYPQKIHDILLHGTNGKEVLVHYTGQRGSGVYPVAFEGLIKNVERRYRETASESSKQEYETFMRITPCKECKGMRLKKESLAVTVCDKNIYEITSMSIRDLQKFLDTMTLTKQQQFIGERVLKEIRARVGFLVDVGLEYLSLARATATLSGGEAQRIRLATQIGSGLVGVCYILDEPSIGLHQRDNDKLLNTLKNLRDLGNTLVVVEHDEDTMLAADYIVDIGPGAGSHGGEVIACGTAEEIMQIPESITGQYLSGKKRIPVPETRRTPTGWIKVLGAQENNLKNVDVEIPLGVMTCVTGVSGSGKTTLILESLIPALESMINGTKLPSHVKNITAEDIEQVKLIDAAPIGINVRSTVATYANVHDELRKIYGRTAGAKLLGYKAGDFSYNTGSLRCPVCDGTGMISLDVQFLPDVDIPCPECRGSRYGKQAKLIHYTNKDGEERSLPELMNMDVNTAVHYCRHMKSVRPKLEILRDLGLGYLTLGEETPSLSGGEAQRLKLASEMGRKQADSVFVFDEPTIGLHPKDVETLLKVFATLIDNGATVIVIEHDLDVIRNADYIIDMGPGGGEEGGRVVACGTPEQIAANEESVTGKYL